MRDFSVIRIQKASESFSTLNLSLDRKNLCRGTGSPTDNPLRLDCWVGKRRVKTKKADNCFPHLPARLALTRPSPFPKAQQPVYAPGNVRQAKSLPNFACSRAFASDSNNET